MASKKHSTKNPALPFPPASSLHPDTILGDAVKRTPPATPSVSLYHQGVGSPAADADGSGEPEVPASLVPAAGVASQPPSIRVESEIRSHCSTNRGNLDSFSVDSFNFLLIFNC